MKNEDYYKLWEVSRKLEPYYVIDKVKPWVIYIYDKESEEVGIDGNIFDIYKNEIVCYGDFKEEEIIPEAIPIIKEVQKYLEE